MSAKLESTGKNIKKNEKDQKDNNVKMERVTKNIENIKAETEKLEEDALSILANLKSNKLKFFLLN